VISAPDVDQVVGADGKLRQLALGLDLGGGEMAALGLRQPLHLGQPDAELQRRIAVAGGGLLGHHLTILDLQHGDRDVLAFIGEDARHSQLLCDDA
jgi:hypothetical protein